MTILSKILQEKVSKMPEIGMGYHKAILILKDGTEIKNVTILNGSIIKNHTLIPEDIIDVKQI